MPGAALLCAATALCGCKGSPVTPYSSFAYGSSSQSQLSYSVAATLSGLNSAGLVLSINGSAVSVASGASNQLLTDKLTAGSAYAVTVQSQPVGETCVVTGGAGVIDAANITNVNVSCADQAFTVGGSVSGLLSSGLVLSNGTDTLNVTSGASSFAMPAPVPYGGSYAITIQAQPAGLTCAVSSGAATMGAAAVTSVAVACQPNMYTVGGSITGLAASGLVLLDNGADSLAITAGATQFTMNTAIRYGGTYAVTVQGVPAGIVCSVSNGAGIVGPSNVTAITVACTPNFTLLHTFAGGSSDGAQPYHSLIQAADGTFYGTTQAGGSGGTVYAITPSGNESLLYTLSEGTSPFPGMVQGGDGNFYGATGYGGTSGRGMLFKLTPGGTESVVYSFAGGSSDGANPFTGVVQGSDGDFYGTTYFGGSANVGAIFKVTPGGTETVLHFFSKLGGDGYFPYAGLIQGSDGNFYGTTYAGGTDNLGTVFKITPSGTESILYSFAGGSDGSHPYAGVIQGADGNLYGTTYQGGASGLGTVFKLTPGGSETVLYAFAGGSSDGSTPEAGLTQGSDGNFYGATYLGGASNFGTVFEVTAVGTETLLHSFAGGSGDGANDWTNLVQGSDGALYGCTYAGGADNLGTFFKITLQ